MNVRKSFTKVLDYFFLLRIPLLAPVWTILMLGWVTGGAHCRLGGRFFRKGGQPWCEGDLWIALAGFSLVVASIYVVNQIVDIESDRINHKLFLLPHRFVSIRAAWILAVACAGLGLFVTIFLDMTMTVLFALSLVLGYLYNLPPALLKNRAWGGVWTNFVGHGVLTYLVGWYAAKCFFEGGAAITKAGIVASLAPGFANAAVFLATTIPDASGDRATGKRTFCVAYGKKKTAIAAALFCVCALAFSFTMQYNRWMMIGPTSISLGLFVYHAVVTHREMAFQTFKWPVFLLSASVSLMVPTYGLLVVTTYFGSKAYYRWRFGIDYPTFKTK